MGKALALIPKDRNRLDSLIRAGWDEKGTGARSSAIDSYVQKTNYALWQRWAEATPNAEARRKFVVSRRPGRIPDREKSVRRATSSPRRAVVRRPLWFVGNRQRDDLRANYSPVPVDFQGALPPELLNRDSRSIRDVRIRIGSEVELVAEDIPPGRRAKLALADGKDRLYRMADLLGGIVGLAFARVDEGPGKTYLHEIRLDYRVAGRARRLVGDLVGTAKRSFYEFRPRRGEATPIYGG